MANAGCINAYDCNGCLIQTLQNLDSACIGVGVQYTAPNPLDDKRLDYIKYTDKCGCTCCLSGENEILIYATQGVIKNFTLTNDDTNEVVNVKWNDLFGSNRAYTMVRYKTGSYPTSITDGTLAVKETTKNQYSSSGYNVSGLTDGTTYYFTAFAVSQDGTTIIVQSSSITTDFFLGKYQAVEYIGTTGPEIIKTELDIKDGYICKFNVAFTQTASSTTDYFHMGLSGGYLGRSGNSNNHYRLYLLGLMPNRKLNMGMMTNFGDIGNALTLNTVYEIEHSWVSGNSYTKLNGTTLQSYSTTRSTTLGGKLTVCGMYQKDQSPQYHSTYAKRYSYKIFNSSNNLIKDLLPCYRKSDNVIGMLDVLNKQFYTNSGTGTFTKGSNIPR